MKDETPELSFSKCKLIQEYDFKENKIWKEYENHQNLELLIKDISDLLCYIGNNLRPLDPTAWFAEAICYQQKKIKRIKNERRNTIQISKKR